MFWVKEEAIDILIVRVQTLNLCHFTFLIPVSP